jgi:two-component system response regulator FixJ
MIYIVEDDVSVRESIGTFLKCKGLKSQSFGSAEEFLSGCTILPDDILILDLNLPGISGYDLLEKINENELKFKIIVTTAFDEPGSRKFCLEHGVKSYLRKPVDGEALLDVIKFNLLQQTL